MDHIIVEDLPSDAKPEQIVSEIANNRATPITHLAIKDRFNIDIPTKEEEGKLAEIWTYAQSVANSSDIPDIIWEVIHLEGVLGSPRLGESRLDKVYRYCKLKRQELQIQSEIKDVASNGRIR